MASEDSAELNAAVAHCDGYRYDNVTTFDLQKSLDYYAFGKKLDTFIDWRDSADEVFENEESGHMHFEINGMEVWCNVQKLSDRFRNIYWTVEVEDVE